MSAPSKQSKAESKRARASGGPADPAATSGESKDHSVRQRVDPPSSSGAAAGSSSATSASFDAQSSASSVSSSTLHPSLMRLAVVERQLMMQALDFASLARLASTCSQLRGEALHKEAGKFIPRPISGRLSAAKFLQRTHPAHACPLFRKHVPISLRFDLELRTLAEFESLLDKAATFSRITFLISSDIPWWTEDRMLRLLSLPCMHELRRVFGFQTKSTWINSPRVQTALLGLPQLEWCEFSMDPHTALLPSALARASKLATVKIDSKHAAVVRSRSLRALRLAPALTSLEFTFRTFYINEPVLAELIWCLPPTLTDLSLWSLEVPCNLPRPLLKALFSRTPLLESLELDGPIEPILRGLLDAGLPVPSVLRDVRFCNVTPIVLSSDEDSDLLRPLLRRFLHRFPQVTVRLDIDEEAWQDPAQLSAVQVRYVGWPRIELYWSESGERIGGPPSPHASDDEDGSDVEEWTDPLAAEAH